MPTSTVRRRVVVAGRVQGVFFRETCRRRAESEGVTGFVRNRTDGTVEAEFEGDGPAVERMIGWCRIGPPHADVRRVDIQPIAATGDTVFAVG